MFRRLQSGLPKDPVYPSTLEALGYFINDKDEIRNIENPKAYFKFFLTKNERYNVMQRESMNEAIRTIVSDRLTALNLSKLRLPLNAKETDPHIPIFVSSNIGTKKRVIILFYEYNQDLGVFAYRIIGGKGGINAGSAVNMVKYIQSFPDPPGIILANIGQLCWWRRGKKAITQTSWYALPHKSAVELPYRFNEEKNRVPGHKSTAEHVSYIFNHVVEELCDPKAKLDVVGVSEGAMKVAEFLDNENNWKKWHPRMDAFAALATYYHASDIENKVFGRWLKERARVYLISQEPCGTFLAGPEGNKATFAHGCPVFSLGEPYYTENMLPKGYKAVVDWLQEVASDANYANPFIARLDDEDGDEEEQHGTLGIDFNRAVEEAG